MSDSQLTASPSIIGFSYVNTMYKNSNNNEKQNKNLPTTQEMENWKQARNRMNGSKKHLCVFVGLEASTKDTVKCIMLSEAVQANLTIQGTEKLYSFKSDCLLTQLKYSEKCTLGESARLVVEQGVVLRTGSAVFLYCCPDCPNCLAHLRSSALVTWAAIKKYTLQCCP